MSNKLEPWMKDVLRAIGGDALVKQVTSAKKADRQAVEDALIMRAIEAGRASSGGGKPFPNGNPLFTQFGQRHLERQAARRPVNETIAAATGHEGVKALAAVANLLHNVGEPSTEFKAMAANIARAEGDSGGIEVVNAVVRRVQGNAPRAAKKASGGNSTINKIVGRINNGDL